MMRSTIAEMVVKATPDHASKGQESAKPLHAICEAILAQPSVGAKQGMQAILKRLRDAPFSRPYIGLRTLTLLDLCIQNCGRPFHNELNTSEFMDEMRRLVKVAHKAVVEQFKCLLVKWVEQDYTFNRQLKPLSDLYEQLKAEGVEFRPSALSAKQSSASSDAQSKREEEELAEAIALSIKESSAHNKTVLIQTSEDKPALPEPRKVRALYDFEAVEDNELTFKAGEVVLVEDDSNEHWWKGSNHRGRGLFPANFVTSDVGTDTKAIATEEKLSDAPVSVRKEAVSIDAELLEATLRMLHAADVISEEPSLAQLEANCDAMAPLIHQEIEKVDKKQAELSALAKQLSDSMNMYHEMMRAGCPSANYYQFQAPGYGAPYIPGMIPPSAPHQMMYPGMVTSNTTLPYPMPYPPASGGMMQNTMAFQQPSVFTQQQQSIFNNVATTQPSYPVYTSPSVTDYQGQTPAFPVSQAYPTSGVVYGTQTTGQDGGAHVQTSTVPAQSVPSNAIQTVSSSTAI